MKDKVWEVNPKGDQSVAVIGGNACGAFSSIALFGKLVEFEGFISKDILQSKLGKEVAYSSLIPSGFICEIFINLFANRQDAGLIGRELSRHRLFLQHPIRSLFETEYDNPHYLLIGNSRLPNGQVLPPLDLKTAGQCRQDNETSGLAASETDMFTVLDDLPKPKFLEKDYSNNQIRTQLLPHQVEGVKFVINRESHSSENGGDLWEYISSHQDPKWEYRHKITKETSKSGNDILGGILADEMGIGKTLTMIAAIASTVSHASVFENGGLPESNMIPSVSTHTNVKSTLVIVPSPLILDVWIQELERHSIPGRLVCYKYHGPRRVLDSRSKVPYDIILTTYNTLTAEFCRGGGVLNRFHWYRLILDEAHSIKNSSTESFKAVMELSAARRWCMSGTPIQNSLDDLQSLVRFLRIPTLETPFKFQKFMTFNSDPETGIREPNYDNLRLLLGSICLRRTTSILPDLGVSFLVHRPNLSDKEKEEYKRMEDNCKASIKSAVNSSRGKSGTNIILTAILLLRMFCNMGNSNSLNIENFSERACLDETESLKVQRGEAVCLKCNPHAALPDKCDACNSQGTKSPGESLPTNEMDGVAPEPRSSMDIPMTDAPSPSEVQFPSKLQALVADIKENYNQHKSIVLSYWIRSLDLVSDFFRAESIKHCRVDGKIPMSQRKKILQEFQDDPSIRVLLITQGTGSTGLNNLSVASRIHILEPQWNPSIESQAIGRVLRLGQHRKVCVVRYIVEGTIEEAVETRQYMKVQLARGGGLHSLSDAGTSERKMKINRIRQLAKALNLN